MVRSSIKSAVSAALFLGLCLTSVSLFGQGAAGRISGTVSDQSGGAIPAGKVTITDVGRGTARTLTTDAAGAYAAPNLTPGNYTVHVEFMGFRSVDRKDVALEVGQDLRVDVTLQPGEQNQTVTVTGEVAAINTTNAELGGTLQNEVINDLPLNGRNFENLLDLRPGVVKYPGNSGWAQSTNGLRPHDNFFMVDGINSNDPWMAQSVMNAVMAAGDAGTMLPIDAIDEFKTNQNPRAEYGWKPGAVVNVGIKSGANAYHGTAYAYGRQDSWDAADFFAPKAPLALEQYGASIGGKIIKDRLFFFGNYESQMYQVGNSVSHKVPITAAGVGATANNLIGSCLAAKTAGNLTALSAQLAGLSTACIPLSNYPGLFPVNNGANGTAINTALASQNTIYSGVGKLDYRLNDKHSFNGLYFQSPGDGTFVDNPTLEIAQPWLTNQYAKSQVVSGNWLWIVNSTMVNSLRVGYSKYHQIFASNDSTQDPANYNYNGTTYHINTGQTNPLYFGLPVMSFQGGYSFQLGLGWPKTVGPNTVTQVTDGISIQKGNHSLKFGGEFLDNHSLNNVTANTKGPVRFGPIGAIPALQNFFSGTLNRGLITAGDLSRDMRDHGFALYAQDDWRLTPRVTVNVGLRYELTTVLKEANNLMGNFIPGQGLVQQDSSKIGSVFNGDHNNFAPRIGFAWDIAGNGKTVVRGGGGVYFEQSSFDSFNAVGNLLGLRTVPTGVNLYSNGSTTPTTAGGGINVGQVTFTGTGLGSATTPGTVKYGWANNSTSIPIYSLTPSCGDGTVTLASGFKPQPCSVLSVDPNLRTPYVTTYNLGIQRAITNNLSLEASYVGNHATKLLGMRDLNQPQLVNGFSPGWGNPADPTSAAGQCLASKATGYDNCNVGPVASAQPYNKLFPYLGYIYQLSNSNVSNYNGLQVSLTQRTQHGLSYVLGYTWSHSLAESNDNWSFQVPVAPNGNQKSLYSSTNFDIRHHFTASLTYAIPGKKTKSQLLDGWSINTILLMQSGAPWGINDTSTDFSGTNEITAQNSNGERWNFYGNPSDFQTRKSFNDTNIVDGSPQTGIPYFPGNSSAANPTDNAACNAKAAAAGPLAVAALANLGCYANGSSILIPPAFGSYGTSGANIFRGLPYYNLDLSITKQFKFHERLTAQFRAEAFNILNHVNISNPFGGPGGDNTFTDPSATAGAGFGFRNETPDITSSNAVLGSGGPRAIQLGLKLIF